MLKRKTERRQEAGTIFAEVKDAAEILTRISAFIRRPLILAGRPNFFKPIMNGVWPADCLRSEA